MKSAVQETKPELLQEFHNACYSRETMVSFLEMHYPRADGWGCVTIMRTPETIRAEF